MERIRKMVVSPGHHDEEIHDVPDVAQIGATVEDEAKGEDLEARLDAEDPEEVDFGSLEFLREYGLVLLGQVLLEGEDHAIGDDGEQDGVLEGRPLDYEPGMLPDTVILRKDKQRRGALAASPTATRPSALIPAWRHVHQTRYLFPGCQRSVLVRVRSRIPYYVLHRSRVNQADLGFKTKRGTRTLPLTRQ